MVCRDLHTAWKQSGDIAAELDPELHSALFRLGGFALVFGSIDEHPQPALTLKPGHEARFRQTMDLPGHWRRPLP